MPGVTVAVLGAEEAMRLAGALGKGDAEGDVARHFFKQGDRAVNLLTPARYPERVQGVSQALLVADHVLLVGAKADRDLGLLILAAAASGAQRGQIVVLDDLTEEQVAPLLENTPLASWPVVSGRDAEAPLLRERLLDLPAQEHPGRARAVVEQAFPVRGLGTVVLGVVTQGTVKRHQALEHHPAGRPVTVRSIQVHDEDVGEAGVGDRVGLALRGVEPAALSRGHVLAEPGAVSTHPAGEPLGVEVEVARFYAPGLHGGRVCHMGIGLQFVPVEITPEDADGISGGMQGRLRVVPSVPVVVASGQRFLLWDLDHGPLRLVGGGRVSGHDESEGEPE